MALTAPATTRFGVTVWYPLGIAGAFFAMIGSCCLKGLGIFECCRAPATSGRLGCEHSNVTISRSECPNRPTILGVRLRTVVAWICALFGGVLALAMSAGSAAGVVRRMDLSSALTVVPLPALAVYFSAPDTWAAIR